MEVAAGVAKRLLGRTGLLVSEVGFGSWGIGGKIWRDSNDQSSLNALSKAFDLGVNFVDTALIYGNGHSEQLIGQALKYRSEQIHIATKVTPKDGGWPPRPGVRFRQAFPLRHVKKCTEESLRNLKRDTVDVQQFHIWSREWTADDDVEEAVHWLKESGKAKFVGISVNDHEPATVIAVLRTGLIDCVQVIYNIFDPSPSDELFPVCQQMNIGVIARVPFDEGSLAGKITPETNFEAGDWRARYFGGDRKQEVCRRVASLRQDLGSNEPLAHTALRFCLSHPAVSTVIPGMSKASHVEENVAAAGAAGLAASTLEVLRRHRWTRNFYN
jgi:aryl-alcohol dehydrogenase-like predicted oxidoreductase